MRLGGRDAVATATPPTSSAAASAESPTISSEKNTPTDSTIPLFWNVARMPDAAPRFSGGTLFMMPVMFGAANSPMPMPFINKSAAKTGNAKLAGRNVSRPKLAAATTMPPVANGRAP